MKIFYFRAFSLFETLPGCRAYSHSVYTVQEIFLEDFSHWCQEYVLKEELCGGLGWRVRDHHKKISHLFKFASLVHA